MSTGRSSGAAGYVGALVQSKTLLSPRDIQEVGGAADTKQAGSGHRQHKGESSSVKVCAAGDVTGFSEREFTQMASLGFWALGCLGYNSWEPTSEDPVYSMFYRGWSL